MQTNWSKSIPLLLVSEGSELNINPPGTPAGQGEPGGGSRYGVSVAALSDLYKSRGLLPATIQDIIDMTDVKAADFYQNVTAKAIRFDDLGVGVDYVMLDITANLGPTGGLWLLQNVLGIWPVGNTISDLIVNLANKQDSKQLIYAIGAAWLSKKHESPGWIKSGHGWTNRMNRVRGDALAMSGV